MSGVIRILILVMLILIYFRLGTIVDAVKFNDARITNLEAAKVTP
jgi:hypothetical protein